MKALKISLLLVAVVLLTVSFVSNDTVVQDETTTFKTDNSKKDLVLKRKKVKVVSNA